MQCKKTGKDLLLSRKIVNFAFANRQYRLYSIFFNNYASIEAVFLMTQTIYKWAKVGVFCYFSPIYQYLYSANKSSMVTTACTMLLYSPVRSPYVVMSVGKMLSFAPVSATKSPIRVRIFRLSAARISGRNLHFFCIFRPLMSAFFALCRF